MTRGPGGAPLHRKKTVHIPIESDAEADASREPGTAGSGEGTEEPLDAVGTGSRRDAPASADAEPAAPKDSELRETVGHLQRLQAEFENYRRRTDRERLETAVWAQGDLVGRILPVLDDLDRAADAVADQDAPLMKGFLLVREKFHRILDEAGLERIPAVGADFDPNLHEALLTEPVEADRAGKVLDELVAGYRYKGRVVRPARVKVGMEGGE